MPAIKRFNLSDYELIICGSGLFGLTIAREYLRAFDKRVLVLEKRPHPGGNSWSEIDDETGIEVHKYGSHLFHTSNEKVWAFVNQFSEFIPYRHKVIAKTGTRFFGLPINLLTLSQFFGNAFSPQEARDFLSKVAVNIDTPKNFEEAAISQIGVELYETFFQNYTRKQWQTNPTDLGADVYRRIPVRFTFEDGYFNDTYQGLPKHGYADLIKRMLDHEKLDLVLEFDFNSIKQEIGDQQIVVYTGPIDQYFDYTFGALGWRTLDFEIERLAIDDFQGNSVVNYVDLDIPFTRIHEFKHLHPEREYLPLSTLIMKEYSRFANQGDEPYYPINTQENRKKLVKYRELISKTSNVFFGGRLGSFQYLDMHMAIASALTMFSNEILPATMKLRENATG
jgi:UDP-galactopyranose mutase